MLLITLPDVYLYSFFLVKLRLLTTNITPVGHCECNFFVASHPGRQVSGVHISIVFPVDLHLKHWFLVSANHLVWLISVLSVSFNLHIGAFLSCAWAFCTQDVLLWKKKFFLWFHVLVTFVVQLICSSWVDNYDVCKILGHSSMNLCMFMQCVYSSWTSQLVFITATSLFFVLWFISDFYGSFIVIYFLHFLCLFDLQSIHPWCLFVVLKISHSPLVPGFVLVGKRFPCVTMGCEHPAYFCFICHCMGTQHGWDPGRHMQPLHVRVRAWQQCTWGMCAWLWMLALSFALAQTEMVLDFPSFFLFWLEFPFSRKF